MHIGIVLGGGLSEDEGIPFHVKERVLAAASNSHLTDLYIASSRYSLNIPPKLDKNGFVRSEASEIAKNLSDLSPNSNIVLENASSDTIGSAIFSRMIIESLEYQPKVISIYTSDFHAERVLSIFEWTFGLLPVFPSLSKISVEETTAFPSVSRINREKNSLRIFRERWGDIRYRHQALRKLLTEHDNYGIHFMSKYISSGKELY